MPERAISARCAAASPLLRWLLLFALRYGDALPYMPDDPRLSGDRDFLPHNYVMDLSPLPDPFAGYFLRRKMMVLPSTEGPAHLDPGTGSPRVRQFHLTKGLSPKGCCSRPFAMYASSAVLAICLRRERLVGRRRLSVPSLSWRR